MKLNELDIVQAAEGLKKGEFSSVDLTQVCLEVIKKLNPEINAFITITEDLALNQAKESDARRKMGNSRGILDGIPVAIKDNIAVKDYPTTAASKILENYITVEDAFVIKKLKEAGAVILGKTNLDEFACGGSTETSYFETTKNPIDHSRVPGGSSGGSAAAVAADMCIYAIGSDTGGSIRQPASYCGIVGLKPTYGAVSRNGLFAMASSLDQIGPLTKTVEDAFIVLKELAKYDEKDSTSNKKGEETIQKIVDLKGVKGLKVGILKQGKVANVQAGIKNDLEKAVQKLKAAGAQVTELNLPILDYALAVYYILMPVEVSSNLGRYDGIKYGYSVALLRDATEGQASSKETVARNLEEVYFKTRAEGFGDEVKRRIMLGAYASSAGYFDQYYLKAQKVRAIIKKEIDDAFKKFDCLLLPTTPTTAFKISEKTKDPIMMYLEDIFTVPANIAGIPGISVPFGKEGNLPFGIQVLGPEFGEEKLLNVAKALEEADG
ncbi:MAG: Asp-tRNA(Asn)/Glu-tRNA(Gln) amidotransferase subunit GatA [Patescibacteria group bacterium]|nr:Asp-tRNA(Asn)/Glu-tRNA(Gln) amidotransferase subunit GatA [Patescibacteria group bacterium]